MGPLDIEDLPTEEIIRRFVSQPSEWHEPKPGVYHASSVWYCLRRNYYKETGVPEERPLPHGLFEMGRRAEDVLFDAIKSHRGERFVRNSIPVRYVAEAPPNPVYVEPGEPEPPDDPPKFVVVGETDVVEFDWDNIPLWVDEVKSSEVRDKKKRNPTEERHKHQAAFYAGRLKHGDNYPGVRILHPGRNDVLNYSETVIDDQAEIKRLYEEAVEYFHQLHDALVAKKLPPAEPKDKGECRWCSFKSKCTKDGGWTNAGGKWVRLGSIKEGSK